jgi:hypothetical protein
MLSYYRLSHAGRRLDRCCVASRAQNSIKADPASALQAISPVYKHIKSPRNMLASLVSSQDVATCRLRLRLLLG